MGTKWLFDCFLGVRKSHCRARSLKGAGNGQNWSEKFFQIFVAHLFFFATFPPSATGNLGPFKLLDGSAARLKYYEL
jgi:hypothetical protein